MLTVDYAKEEDTNPPNMPHKHSQGMVIVELVKNNNYRRIKFMINNDSGRPCVQPTESHDFSIS